MTGGCQPPESDGENVIKGFEVDDGNLNWCDMLDLSQSNAIKDFSDPTRRHVMEVHGNAVIFAGDAALS